MENRTAITLAILSSFFFIVQAIAVAGRVYHRVQANKYAAKDLRVGAVGWSWDDYLVFIAYAFGIANWILLIWAGFEGLGTQSVIEDDDLVQRLFIAIQFFLILSNFLAKSSFALLLTRLASTQSGIAKLARALSAGTAVLGLIAALVVIIPCWPGASSSCFNDSYRWILFTVLDVLTELAIIGWPLYTLRNIQFRDVKQRWKLALVIIIGRCSVIPLSISFCVVMLQSTKPPFLGPQILNPVERQQGLLLASLFTSTMVPVFNLFQITKIEVFESSVELNITKTVEVHMDDGQKKKAADSSAASLSPSQADTRELLDRQVYTRAS